jgi:hypothetical protein
MKIPTEKEMTIDEFVGKLINLTLEIENYSKYLRLIDEEKVVTDKAFKIINKKIKEMKKSNSIDEISKHLKVKKIMENKKEN